MSNPPTAMSRRHPRADLAAVRAGSSTALLQAILALARLWMSQAGHPIAVPVSASSVAVLEDTTKAGLLAAGADLVSLLAQSPEGRQAIRDFGLEPILQHVERE